MSASLRHITRLMEYPSDSSSTRWQLAVCRCQPHLHVNAWIMPVKKLPTRCSMSASADCTEAV